MKQIQSICEIRNIQLDILNFLDKICKEHKICYFLSGGTLLGAVRHKGYIPWDDDIDIMLLRKDYDKLISVLKQLKDSKYILFDGESAEYYLYFSKLVDSRTQLKEINVYNLEQMGVFVDIFPLDGVPDAEKSFNRYYRKLQNYNKNLFRTIHYKKKLLYKYKNQSFCKGLVFIKLILRTPFVIYSKSIGLERWKAKREKYLRLYYGLNTKNLGILLSAYKKKDVHSSQLFKKSVLVTFEGQQYPAPSGYDVYLKNIYGNYMELPPTNQRYSHHKFNAFWR